MEAAEISTLSLHDALPILQLDLRSLTLFIHIDRDSLQKQSSHPLPISRRGRLRLPQRDRKSTRLNSSHVSISYAVFCLKKKISSCNALHSRKTLLLAYTVL